MVTYRPDAGLAAVLSAAARGADRVLVWDNGDRPEDRARVIAAVAVARAGSGAAPVDLEPAPENQGLGVAFARALTWAAEDRADLLLLLDQDSLLRPGASERLRAELLRLRPTMRVGALAARNHEEVTVRVSPKTALGRLLAAHEEGEYARGRWYRDSGVEEVRAASNSGLAVVVDAARDVGGFDPQLFVDAIDYDLLVRLRAGGFRTLRVPGAGVDHAQGRAVQVGSSRVSLTVRTYSTARSYHLVRDTLLASRKIRRHERGFALAVVLWMAIGTAGALLLLGSRSERARAVLRGLVAGLSEPLRAPPRP